MPHLVLTKLSLSGGSWVLLFWVKSVSPNDYPQGGCAKMEGHQQKRAQESPMDPLHDYGTSPRMIFCCMDGLVGKEVLYQSFSDGERVPGHVPNNTSVLRDAEHNGSIGEEHFKL